MIYRCKAEDKDVGVFADLAHALYIESFPSKPFDREYFMSFWASMIDRESGAVWLSCTEKDNPLTAVGAIGGFMTVNIYSGARQSTMMFWHAHKKYRGRIDNLRLFDHYQKWSIENGAKTIYMNSLLDADGNKLRVIYERLGAKTLELVHEITL